MKHLFLIIILVIMSITVSAGEISRTQAREKARHFLSQKHMDQTLADVTSQQSQGDYVADCYYVFNVGENDGFVIVSGDDRTPEILGYTDAGAFDADNLPPNFAAWLQGYADQIKYMREQNVQPTAQTQSPRKARAAVNPLIQTKWGQGYPYNIGYPEVNGNTCITGCVATALAQVLYYHKNTASTTEIPGYTTSKHHIVMETLPPTTFDWDNMALSYSGNTTAVQNEAVSHLMIYCSTAVKADLDPNGTGAYSYQQLVSLRNYFGYVKDVKEKKRDNFSLAQWENMLYDEVIAGRPVLYSGNGGNGMPGHAFVLDGYDGYYFHFNWGWNGSYDGHFALTAITPNGYDFSYNQYAITGISLTEIEPPIYDEDVRLTTDVIYPNPTNQFVRSYPSPDGIAHYTVRFTAKYSSHLQGTYDIDNNYAIFKDQEFIEYLYPFEVENPKFGINWNMTPDEFFPYGYEELTTLPHGENDGEGNTTHGKSFLEAGTYYIVPISRLHGDLDWKLNINSDEKFLKAVIDEEDVLTLYKGVPEENPMNPSGIKSATQDDDVVIGRYDLNGRRVNGNYKGIMVEVQKNGRATLRKK